MRGQITLDSTLGVGTRATFSIPFHKPQFRGGASPLVNLESIPPRLQSELSLSSCPSDQGSVTPPPPNSSGISKDFEHDRNKGLKSHDSVPASSGPEGLSEMERARIHVLVVEDKYAYLLRVSLG
jgi:hypothetical protein